jgi:formiminotetrahydrofolate cyclodeaminase
MGAVYNVKINLKEITDSAFVEEISKEIREIEAQVTTAAHQALSAVHL